MKKAVTPVNELETTPNQVQTIVDFSQGQPTMLLACPTCVEPVDRIGAKFCSNCGSPLVWNNIKIRPAKPETTPAELEVPGNAAKS